MRNVTSLRRRRPRVCGMILGWLGSYSGNFRLTNRSGCIKEGRQHPPNENIFLSGSSGCGPPLLRSHPSLSAGSHPGIVPRRANRLGRPGGWLCGPDPSLFSRHAGAGHCRAIPANAAAGDPGELDLQLRRLRSIFGRQSLFRIWRGRAGELHHG